MIEIFSRGWQWNNRRSRRMILFASTAISALPLAGYAQLAPNTTPLGGVVVAGSASIAKGPASDTVTQASERAAINWQSFNVGGSAQVQFEQPNGSAIALNRVVGGDLSEIDGKITANGQIVLINQSGVVFGKGSQINAESILVSTSNISDSNFMAGNMAFTGAPNPGAKIINDGTISVGEAGLVGLVAPQVANSGVITARLGQVTLAGATAFTLDLYGDQLVSLDVTRAVRSVDVGGKAVPALVTNSGLILADGGHITLTAAQSDALVTQLINAGGTIRADTTSGQAGTIALQGVGGNITIAGNLLARGSTAGSSGGAVEAMTTGTVAVAPAALIDVSGPQGGGVVALGTSLAVAVAGPSDAAPPAAAYVNIAKGATIRADATAAGKGGTVALMSADSTVFLGDISVQGGTGGGDGGAAEISSQGVIQLGGSVLATAIDGKPGEILLDPQTLIVTLGGNATSTGNTTFGGTDNGTIPSLVDPRQLSYLEGDVTLEAASLIAIASPTDLTFASGLFLDSLGSISINAPVTVEEGLLALTANSGIAIDAELTAPTIELDSNGNTVIDALVDADNLLRLQGRGSFIETTNGSIDAGELYSNGVVGGNVSLNYNNSIAQIGQTGEENQALSLSVAGTFALNDAIPLDVSGPLTAADISLATPTLSLDADIAAGSPDQPGVLALAFDTVISSQEALDTSLGTIEIAPYSLTQVDVSGTTANPLDLDLSSAFLQALETSATVLEIGRAGTFQAAGVTLEGTSSFSNPVLVLSAADQINDLGQVNVSTLEIDGGGFIQSGGGAILTSLFQGDGQPIGGSLLLTGADNKISVLGSIDTGDSDLTLDDASPLTIAGPLSANDISFDDAKSLIISGTVIALGALSATGDMDITQNASDISSNSATFNAPGGIDFSGTTDVATTLDLISSGSVTQSGGRLTAGTLTGSVGSIGFDGVTDFNTIGSFIVQTGAFALENAGPLTLLGPLLANALSLTVNGLLTLEGSGNGGLFIGGSIAPPATTAPRPGDTTITVNLGNDGGPDAVIQTGTFFINNGPDVAPNSTGEPANATVFLTAKQGNIAFATAGSLDAPHVDLVLNDGAGGTISGEVNLYQVVILDAARTQLFGYLDGIGGQAAAAGGFVNPSPEPAQQFNACEIGVSNCLITTSQIAPPSTQPVNLNVPPLNITYNEIVISGGVLQASAIEELKKRKLGLPYFGADEEIKRRLAPFIHLPGVALQDF